MSMGAPGFLLLTGAAAHIDACRKLGRGVAERVAQVLGFAPELDVSVLAGADLREPKSLEETDALSSAIEGFWARGVREIFLLPVMFELDLWQRGRLVEATRRAQRGHPELELYYDDVSLAHPLLVQAFLDAAAAALARLPHAHPQRLGVMLAAAGQGDAMGRAQSYQLMRLLWEQLGCARGEVGFVRHERVGLAEQLQRLEDERLDWLVVGQFLWESEARAFAQVIAGDFARKWQRPLPLSRALGEHPNISAWVEQRLLVLWRSRRRKDAVREASPRNARLPESRVFGPRASAPLCELEAGVPPSLRYGGAVVARLQGPAALADLLQRAAPPPLLEAPRVLVKVTWHGYATGTFTDPLALDALLAALPGKAVLLEGHSTGRCESLAGKEQVDWERDGARERVFLREQEQRFLQRTGLHDVMARHGASYLNVSEAHWDGACAEAGEVEAFLAERGVALAHRELLGFVPRALWRLRGAPMISYARFKGPTRLSLSNLFGLLPPPLRTRWHGPNITYFARVVCDLAKLYGTLFALAGLVESLQAAVRWNEKGLYRCRWGNYDLVRAPGVVTLAPDLPSADVLASRLQGQNVTRSAFFDVVRHELGYDAELASAPLEQTLIQQLS